MDTFSWSSSALPDLTGRTAVVTGATRGIGRAVREALEKAGATVLGGARTVDGAGVEVLDLADLGTVRAFARSVRERVGQVDLLVNNAAISNVPFSLTPGGTESQFAVNHLGHFALTHLLRPLMREGARVVTVTSAMYPMLDTLDLAALADEGSYSPGVAYVRSKAANVLFATELERRLRTSGSGVRSLLAEPGLAATSMHDGYPDEGTTQAVRAALAETGRPASSASAGVLYAATAGEVDGFVVYGPVGDRETPDVVATPIAGLGLDQELAAALWEQSARLTEVVPVSI
ncbi:SDR family NAD(P)-dependent oxidoreductase [Streptomyces sp. NPDC048106]|uniref:SDR family NAD(P)-dependent oxidoreductase n=1 Tax=Streptomyces sp. NPDC048106 TaxID=3155750 RepID=UPI003455F25E